MDALPIAHHVAPQCHGQANETVWDLTATHAGQLFFNQDLIIAFEKTAAYTVFASD
ncbi:hypothetical protein PMIN03_010494 [Paraphaeosphaeria minitans]